MAAEADKLFAPAQPKAAEPTVVDTTAANEALRTWTDNTGRHQVRGRLMVVTATHIRLLKENGRFTTVPRERLSSEDLAFVARHPGAIAANN